jgi:4-hydroxy-tetrahydrodipicolinate synthase
MKDRARLTGVLSPVVTPFHEDLSVDRERLISHCRWLLSQDCGLALFGTNSEANSQSIEERMELLEAVVASGLDPARMMPGTGCCALPDTVRLSSHAVGQGCAGVLMLPPFYYKGVSDDGLYAYFAEVIERVGDDRLRIYLYHIPPVAQVPISLALIEHLLKAYPGTVVGIKDSSGDWNNTRAMIDAFGDSFDVFAGSETFLLANMRAGGAGCISATANVNPGPIADLARNWETADADERQEALTRTRKTVQDSYTMISALKAVIGQYSGDPAWATVRPPLVRMPADAQRELKRQLDALGFAMPGIAG